METKKVVTLLKLIDLSRKYSESGEGRQYLELVFVSFFLATSIEQNVNGNSLREDSAETRSSLGLKDFIRESLPLLKQQKIKTLVLDSQMATFLARKFEKLKNSNAKLIKKELKNMLTLSIKELWEREDLIIQFHS